MSGMIEFGEAEEKAFGDCFDANEREGQLSDFEARLVAFIVGRVPAMSG